MLLYSLWPAIARAHIPSFCGMVLKSPMRFDTSFIWARKVRKFIAPIFCKASVPVFLASVRAVIWPFSSISTVMTPFSMPSPTAAVWAMVLVSLPSSPTTTASCAACAKASVLAKLSAVTPVKWVFRWGELPSATSPTASFAVCTPVSFVLSASAARLRVPPVPLRFSTLTSCPAVLMLMTPSFRPRLLMAIAVVPLGLASGSVLVITVGFHCAPPERFSFNPETSFFVSSGTPVPHVTLALPFQTESAPVRLTSTSASTPVPDVSLS